MIKFKQYKFESIYIFISFLVLVYISFSMVLTQFYPTLNDILGILKIASLNGTEKWLNGFYGPGYTVISNFIGVNILNWGLLYIGVVFLSLITSMYFIKKLNYPKLDSYSKYMLLFGSILFHLFLFLKVGLNYSDGIFIFLLFSGMNLYFSSQYETSYTTAQIIGLIMMGSTILFRTHGLLFSIITLVLLLVSSKVLFKHIAQTLIILLVPTFLYIGLFYINNIPYQNWQKFNIYKFIYGLNWYQIDILLESNKYQNFSLFNTITSNPLQIIYRILVVLKSSFSHTFLFFIVPLIAYFYTRKLFFISVFIISVLYFLLILPGWPRGIYPLYLLLYMTIIHLYENYYKSLFVWSILMGILIIYIVIAVQRNYTQSLNIRYYASYVKEELEPTLSKAGVKNIDTVFTDDYDLYLYKFDILKINSFNGWVSLHPNKREEHPNQMFKQLSFNQNNIKYILVKKWGYIEKNYTNIPCKKKILLKFHDLCILK